MNEADSTKVLLLYVKMGMRVVATRLALMLALVMTFGLFCWAMLQPDYTRIGCATIFALLVFLPSIRVDARMASERAVLNEGDR